jgi:hypothetical protein
VKGQKVIAIIVGGIVVITLIAVIMANQVGPPPTVPPDPTPTPRVAR